MPPLAIFAIFILSVSLPLLGWSVLARPDRVRLQVVANLHRGFAANLVTSSDTETASERASEFHALTQRLTPKRTVRGLDRLLARAGRPAGWPLQRVIAAKLVLALVVGLISLLYGSAVSGAMPVALGIFATVLAYFVPDLLLYSRAQKRGQEITATLPDALDQMTIAVEAGLGFDSAMARIGKNGGGTLAEEFIRTLQDIQVGQSRRQAYEALAKRTTVLDLRKFTRAIVQADMHGVSIAGVLRTQAAEMRMKRRQRAEERAMQIPVKVIFPLMLCILPVLFIVLLGPAVMDIVAAFSTM